MPIKVTFKKLLVQGHCTILYFLWSVTCREALVQSKQEWHVLSVLYTELYSVNYKLGYFFKISATTHWPTTYCVQIWTQLIKNTWIHTACLGEEQKERKKKHFNALRTQKFLLRACQDFSAVRCRAFQFLQQEQLSKAKLMSTEAKSPLILGESILSCITRI